MTVLPETAGVPVGERRRPAVLRGVRSQALHRLTEGKFLTVRSSEEQNKPVDAAVAGKRVDGPAEASARQPAFSTAVPFSAPLFFLPFLLSDTVLVLLVRMANQRMKTVFHKGTSIWNSVRLTLQLVFL